MPAGSALPTIATCGKAPADGPFQVLAEIIRLADSGVTDRRAVVRGIVAETNKRAAIRDLVRRELVSDRDEKLLPTAAGRSVVASALKRGRATAALLVGRWFATINHAFRPKPPAVGSQQSNGPDRRPSTSNP